MPYTPGELAAEPIDVLEVTHVRLAFIAVAVASVTLTACGPRPEPQQVTVGTSDDFRFEPQAVRVQVAKPVRLTVKNQGRVEHDFTVTGMPARDVRNDTGSSHDHSMAAGTVTGHATAQGEAAVSFTPTAKGSYEFFCSVAGHKDAGMRGTLEVE